MNGLNTEIKCRKKMKCYTAIPTYMYVLEQTNRNMPKKQTNWNGVISNAIYLYGNNNKS